MSREAEATPNLLPCPFCGTSLACISRFTVTPDAFKVRCNNCFVRTGDFLIEAHAIAQWNNRTNSLSANEARIARLEEALKSSATLLHLCRAHGGVFDACSRESCVAARAALQSE